MNKEKAMKNQEYTKEEQQVLLNQAAQDLGYADWAEYKAAELNWSDEKWDY